MEKRGGRVGGDEVDGGWSGSGGGGLEGESLVVVVVEGLSLEK